MNKKALALILGGLVLIALIIYFVFFYNFNKSATPSNQTSQTQTAAPVVSKNSPGTIKTGVPQTPEEKSRAAANELAIFFAERYGTSSSQADFSNLRELEMFMTDPMKARTESYIASERAKTTTTPSYQSIVTQAVLVEFVTFNAVTGEAQGTVKTKRRETAADGKVTDYNQDLSISLKKVGDDWRVDSATWK